jgi:hypothetical protein
MSSWIFLLVYSKAKLKSNSDKASSCFRSFSVGNVSGFAIGFTKCVARSLALLLHMWEVTGSDLGYPD